MKDLFTKFHENEKNENAAFILMLGVLSEKLTDIADLISMSNKLSKEILSSLDGAKNSPRKEIVIVQPYIKRVAQSPLSFFIVKKFKKFQKYFEKYLTRLFLCDTIRVQ